MSVERQTQLLFEKHDEAQGLYIEKLLKDVVEEKETEEITDLTDWKRFLQIDSKVIPYRYLVEHGVPDLLRGPVWKKLSQSEVHITERRSFEELLAQSSNSNQDALWAIEKDIARTFPKHVLFETQQGQDQLSKVLRAYATCDPSVGYCQGMGFIAAFLLCYTSPEDAFWILRAMMFDYDMRSMLLPGMPKFAPAMRELTRFIEILLPDVAIKLSYFQIDPSIFASQWFITLFVYNIPFSLVARIWDLFFVKKWSIVFRISIALLELIQDDLRVANDMETVLRLLKSIAERIDNVNVIIEKAIRLNVDEDDVRILGNLTMSESDAVVLGD